MVRYCEAMDEHGYLASGKLKDLDGMDISVAGNEERITLLARFDNLGKGASGAAIQAHEHPHGRRPLRGADTG